MLMERETDVEVSQTPCKQAKGMVASAKCSSLMVKWLVDYLQQNVSFAH